MPVVQSFFSTDKNATFVLPGLGKEYLHLFIAYILLAEAEH
jgi:hypothetical protein